MANSTSITYRLKRKILTFTNKISRRLSKPDRKFTADMVYGILASRSCLLTDISDQLHETAVRGKVILQSRGCGHFLGPLILRYPHLSCCYKSLALSVLNWTQPSEGKLNSFFCVPVYIFIENLDKLLDSNISP